MKQTKNTAKFYVYRNLHTGGFSIRYRGIVIERSNNFIAKNISFKVNETGRLRVIAEGRKNVHAYTVCDKYTLVRKRSIEKLKPISYNPYNLNQFTCNGVPIKSASKLLFQDGKCYLVKE